VRWLIALAAAAATQPGEAPQLRFVACPISRDVEIGPFRRRVDIDAIVMPRG